MTTPNTQASAKIYQFPVRDGTKSAVGAEAATARTVVAPPTISGAGWYHDAAIQDAKRPGKR